MAEYRERLRQLEAELSQEALVVAQGENLQYLTGFTGERDRAVAFVVTPEGDRMFISPEAYAGQIRSHSWVDDVRTVPHNDLGAVGDRCGAVIHRSSAEACRVDGNAPAELTHPLRKRLESTPIALATPLLTSLRMRKDDTERAALQYAAQQTDAVSEWVRSLGTDVIGMTESDLASRIRAKLHERDAERTAFSTVVASGPNGARPTTYRHGERTIEAGEPVVLDFGGIFEEYASDQTRTVVFGGDPPDGYEEVHAIVKKALDRGIARARPGITTGELDQEVRAVIADAGYGPEFTTSTGHGIGLRAHEPPAVRDGGETVLEPGMAFTIEPGVYLEGEYGVRLETVVIVTDDGCTPLNTSPYGWRVD